MSIKSIKARMIYDSRGNPTVEVDVTTDLGVFTSSCPSGASTGASEACELRDHEEAHHGKGVTKAIANITETIAPALVGKPLPSQSDLDTLLKSLDGTENKTKLGANAILPVSMAICRANAAERSVPLHVHIASLLGDSSAPTLPLPCFNIINGGEHAGNAICVQEFMICPAGAGSFREAMQMASETYHTLRALLKKRYGIESVNVGDEGGFAPSFEAPTKKSKKVKTQGDGLESISTALDVVVEAINASKYKDRIRIGMDAAATSFYDEKSRKYVVDYKGEGKQRLGSEAMVEFYGEMIKKHPISFIEDPLAEEDWDGFRAATEKLGVPIIGDDLLTTNPKRIAKAVEKGACNALLLKLNQIGTVSEAIEAVKLAKKNGWKVMTSHRSGETNDDFIADLAVGLRTDLIKSGAPCRGERLAKYNRLMKIEEELGEDGKLHKLE